ncbi:MAG: glutathione S-transferase family protein [Xanthomonadales bacterium]|nr:glutathione S-transferase family protein [Xanthomonadales bacterium]
MAEVTIFTSRNCGWAVRNYAALIEKGVAFDPVPAKDGDGVKLDTFLSLTPYGRTPVLYCEGTAVFESSLINEYIDDRFPNPPLLPSDAAARSEVRKWTHYCENSLLAALTRIAKAQEGDARTAAIAEFKEQMCDFARFALPADWRGPYFFGKRFTLLDLVFSTLFETIRQIERHSTTSLPMQNEAMRRWAENVLSRPSLRSAMALRDELEF